MNKSSHIRRIDQPQKRTFCWKVQVQRRHTLATMQFSDAKYGGKRKAYLAAVAWRDATIARLEASKARIHDHLYRVESGNKGRYWQGHFQCREIRTRKQFCDADYGGKRAALAAALAWRDQAVASSKHDWWLRSVSQVRRNNRSGIVGVGRYSTVEVVDGRRVERVNWMARWNDEAGKTCCRKFSVRKYGEKAAKSMAIAARDEAITSAAAERNHCLTA